MPVNMETLFTNKVKKQLKIVSKQLIIETLFTIITSM